MKVGVYQIDITPEPGVELCGFASREQPSVRVFDNLYARVVLLEDNLSRFILINLDLIGVERVFVEHLRKKIRIIFNIPENHIQVFATHTHSGPGTIHLNYCGDYDREYVDSLPDRIMGGILEAEKNLEACAMQSLESELELGVNRRNGDKRSLPLKILALKDSGNGFKACFVNYPMHPVCLKGTGISADYPGQVRKNLSEGLPGNPIVIFGLGPAGDIDPPGVGVSFELMKSWGRKISGSVVDMINSHPGEYLKKIHINNSQAFVNVFLDTKTPAEIDEYASRYLAKDSWLEEFGPVYTAAVKKWRRDMKELVSAGAGMTREIEINCLKFGETALIFINAELFSELENILKVNLEMPFMLISCANGIEGYFPDREEYERGGYEVETAIFFYNSFMPKPGSLEKIAEEAAACAHFHKY